MQFVKINKTLSSEFVACGGGSNQFAFFWSRIEVSENESRMNGSYHEILTTEVTIPGGGTEEIRTFKHIKNVKILIPGDTTLGGINLESLFGVISLTLLNAVAVDLGYYAGDTDFSFDSE